MSIGEYSHRYPWAAEAIPGSMVDLTPTRSGVASPKLVDLSHRFTHRELRVTWTRAQA